MKIYKSIKFYLLFIIELNKLLIMKLGTFSPFLNNYKQNINLLLIKNYKKPQNKLTPIYINIKYY